MKRRLFIFLTGQPRCFQTAFQSLIHSLIKPNQEWHEYYLFIGVDADEPLLIPDGSKQWFSFLSSCLARKQDCPDFEMGKQHLLKTPLCPSWKDYLLNRSGSVLEYAQFSLLFQQAIALFPPKTTDLLLRFRTDTILTTPWVLPRFPPCILFSSSPLRVFTEQFPNAPIRDWKPDESREGCILPPLRRPNKWIISLRKNLLYLTPYENGSWIQCVVRYYGKWDRPTENDYWFNAESQFRGLFRENGFLVLDFSQQKDEAHPSCPPAPEFPIYAIQRAR